MVHGDIRGVFVAGDIRVNPVLVAKDLFNVSFVVNFYVVLCLENVNAIKSVNGS